MKTSLIILLLLIPFIGLAQKQDSLQSKASIASALAPEWNRYTQACYNDSSLQIWWVYTGKEKPEVRLDSTMVKGKKIRTLTIIPTQQMQWIRPTPTWEGFEQFLKIIKK